MFLLHFGKRGEKINFTYDRLPKRAEFRDIVS